MVASGDLVGAPAVLERAVELGKVNLSEDDPDVLRTACELGGCYFSARMIRLGLGGCSRRRTRLGPGAFGIQIR
jgi:hypothetical protein